MRVTLVSILILSFLLNASQEWMAITSFKLHQTEIADKYCINKFKKGSCCEGSCFLGNWLIDLNDEQENPLLVMPSEKLTLFFAQLVISEETAPLPMSSFTSHIFHYLFEWRKSVDHPPEVMKVA